MSWPSSSDPFYLANQTDNDARRAYYSVNATPTMKCDGSSASWPSIQSSIQSRLQVASHLWLSLTGQVLGDTLIMTCTAVADRNISGNISIHFALLDIYTSLPNSPNGQPNHYHALRKFAPTAAGETFSATALDTVYYGATFGLDPTWALDDLDMACFVQDNSTKEVLQAICASVPLDFPNIILTDYEVSDPTGNGDGRVDPGETGEMVATLQNQPPFHDAEQVVAVLSTQDPLIQVTNATVNYPNLPSGSSAANSENPFEFYVDPTFEAHEVTFTITVTAQPGSFQAAYPVTFMVGRPAILLVNDDVAGNYQTYYESSLDSINRVHDSWNQVLAGAIPAEEMLRYPMIIWYTGSDAGTVLSVAEQQKIEGFLNSGGRLLLSSQNAGDALGGTPFYQSVLHAEHLANSVGNDFPIEGVPGDPISAGTSLLPLGGGGAANANSCASFNPISPAVGIYTYHAAGTFGGLRFNSEIYRLVYMAFPIEAVSGAGGSTTRSQLLDNCLAWLETPLTVEPGSEMAALPTNLEIAPVYPNPFNPATEIEFRIPAPGPICLDVYDLQGKLVSEIAAGYTAAGSRKIRWDAASLPSGIYLIKLTAGSDIASAKAVLLK